ncbi:MAG TPA: tRNA (adenosine(37)-N6)-threonylcarbamoyltransferase complex transferase subunit TsaD [Dehalococcoidia bacterium]|nr:tRNA (adenosine(37)-N6)-threonylcarbamoyltransferase complex transferase subunit TsaD [Dehalococcoidia bacterium]
MNILGIETSCDETAVAVVADGARVLSNVVASQVDIHARYGGIVPEVASRQHLLAIIPTLEEALSQAGVSWTEISGVAVCYGPGLAGSLIVGLNMAKALAWAHRLPLIGVNHLEAHLYANWLMETTPTFPLVGLIVSGGHTDLVLAQGHGDYRLLGRTRDDAAGEAFDKGARILGLGYPGGPAIQRASQGGDPHRYPLPRAWLKGSWDFSFSGLKTALLRLVEEGQVDLADPASVADAAASFQEAVAEVLVTKTVAAARHRAGHIAVAGGVAANRRLREAMLERSPLPVLIPDLSLCTDNAAMVAACGYYRLQRGEVAGWDLDAIPGLRMA